MMPPPQEGAAAGGAALANGAGPAHADADGIEGAAAAAAPQTDAAPAPAAAAVGAWDSRDDLPAMPHYRLRHQLRGHSRAVASVKFARQGCLLASASADSTAKLWDAGSGQLLHTLEGHHKGLSDVCWNQEGSLVATASDDTMLRLWDAGTGRCLRVLEGHTHYAFSCCFSEGGNLLASGSFDETLRLWDVRSGKCLKIIPGHSDPVTSVDFNGDEGDPGLASASFDGLARLWKANTGKCVQSLMDRDNPSMSFVKFTPNNRYLLVGTLNSRLCLWDYTSKKVKKVYQGHSNKHLCLQAAFLTSDPSGCKYVVCGSEDHNIYFWELNQPKAVSILRGRPAAAAAGDGHSGPVLSVAAHPALPMLASAGYEGDTAVRVWRHSASGGGE